MAVGEVLAGGLGIVLALRAQQRIDPAPGGIQLEKRVLDEVTLAHDHVEGYSSTVRIALVSPYSWTYPGGVTRHIEALSRELQAQGHEASILAPFDPTTRSQDACTAVLDPSPERRPRIGLAWTDRCAECQRRGIEHLVEPALGLQASRGAPKRPL